jgi:hypothetical protein
MVNDTLTDDRTVIAPNPERKSSYPLRLDYTCRSPSRQSVAAAFYNIEEPTANSVKDADLD